MIVEENKKTIDWLKFLINFVGTTLVVGILLGFSTFILGESNKILNYLGTIFIFLFYISGTVFWIIMLINSAKSKKWGWFLGMLVLWLLGAITYYGITYKSLGNKDLR
ncbi:MAG TPA: hypothetical protein VJI73_00025 [Candidatus Paceibacterota bacterium]